MPRNARSPARPVSRPVSSQPRATSPVRSTSQPRATSPTRTNTTTNTRNTNVNVNRTTSGGGIMDLVME